MRESAEKRKIFVKKLNVHMNSDTIPDLLAFESDTILVKEEVLNNTCMHLYMYDLIVDSCCRVRSQV